MSKEKCSIPGCFKDVHGNGLCKLHYQRQWKHGDPLYERQKYTICTVENCSNKTRSNSSPYCEKHYYRLRRGGVLELRHMPLPILEHSNGYVLIYMPNHSLTINHTGSYEYEHRIVYYNAYGEGPFKCHWCGKEISWDSMHVDHLNDIRNDNNIDNLVASCPTCNQHRGRHKMRQTMRSKYGHWIEFNGHRKLLGQWANELNITRSALQFRLKAGWPLERVFTEGRGKCGPKASRK